MLIPKIGQNGVGIITLAYPFSWVAVPVSNSSSRILVVDDLIDNLFLLQTVLEAEGYEVDTADNGRLALAKVEQLPPDLILVDVMMPDMNGYEVTRRIRQNRNLPDIPILLVTAHADADAAQGIALGANDFIRKPIEFDKLLSRIETFLQVQQKTCSSWALWCLIGIKASPGVLARGVLAMFRFEETATLPQISVPTLVLVGKSDIALDQ